jgi:Tfp pilus assembly protein PilO
MADDTTSTSAEAEGGSTKKQEGAFKEVGDIIKSYIFPIVAVLGLGLMTYFVYVPYVSKIPALISEQRTLDSNIKTLDGNIAKLQTFNSLPLDTMSSTLDGLIPTEAKVAELVEELSSLADSVGMEVTVPEENTTGTQEGSENNEENYVEDIIAGESDSGTEYQVKRVPVTLRFVGTREQIEQFITLIRDEPRLLSVESASIQAGQSTWQVELVVNGYKGEILTTSLSSSDTIDASSDLVLSSITSIATELSTDMFDSVTSRFSSSEASQ